MFHLIIEYRHLQGNSACLNGEGVKKSIFRLAKGQAGFYPHNCLTMTGVPSGEPLTTCRKKPPARRTSVGETIVVRNFLTEIFRKCIRTSPWLCFHRLPSPVSPPASRWSPFIPWNREHNKDRRRIPRTATHRRFHSSVFMKTARRNAPKNAVTPERQRRV